MSFFLELALLELFDRFLIGDLDPFLCVLPRFGTE